MSPYKLTKIEAGVRAVIQFTEAFNRGDVAGMMALLGDDCRFETNSPAPDGLVLVGKAAITGYWRDYFRDTRRPRLEVEELYNLGLRCVRRWRLEWTDDDGQTRSLRGVDIFEIKRGLINEILSYGKSSTDANRPD